MPGDVRIRSKCSPDSYYLLIINNPDSDLMIHWCVQFHLMEQALLRACLFENSILSANSIWRHTEALYLLIYPVLSDLPCDDIPWPVPHVFHARFCSAIQLGWWWLLWVKSLHCKTNRNLDAYVSDQWPVCFWLCLSPCSDMSMPLTVFRFHSMPQHIIRSNPHIGDV